MLQQKEKLKAYEDTGLTPGEVQYLKDKSEPGEWWCGHQHINHIIQLVMKQSASVRYVIQMWLRMMIFCPTCGQALKYHDEPN